MMQIHHPPYTGVGGWFNSLLVLDVYKRQRYNNGSLLLRFIEPHSKSLTLIFVLINYNERSNAVTLV